MRRLAITCLLLAVCASICESTSARDFTPAIDASAAQMKALVAEKKIPSAAVAVIVGDRIVWHETYGDATAETRFRIGSLTKLITVAALMRLVEQKKVALDDPISKYLPDFPAGAATLRQLAGHSAGVRHYMANEFLNSTHYDSATASLDKFLKDHPLIAQPGERYFYSSYGYNTLGAVIEKVTGKTFDKAVDELVFGPFEMKETSFADDKKSAKLFDLGNDGVAPAPAVDLSDRLPSGAAVSTARDLARFLIATAALPKATQEAMFTSQTTRDSGKTNVGLGWRIAQDDKGRTFVHHGGAVTGGRAMVVLYPEQRVGVVIVTNLGFAPFNEKQTGEIARRFLE